MLKMVFFGIEAIETSLLQHRIGKFAWSRKKKPLNEPPKDIPRLPPTAMFFRCSL